jgi:small subunit ribosomal protein S6
LTYEESEVNCSWVFLFIFMFPLCVEEIYFLKEQGHMPLYEHVFLARQGVSVQEVEQLVEVFKKVIESFDGALGKIEYWGLRDLAYKIKGNQRKAHYVLLNIDAPPKAISEMERQMRLNATILRFLTVRVDAHEEDPSVMLRDSEKTGRHGKVPRHRSTPHQERGDTPVSARQTTTPVGPSSERHH